MAKKIIGLVEKIKVIGKSEEKTLALVDTGAKLTSVDIKLAADTGIGPVKRITKIKSASKNVGTRRPVLEATIEIAGKRFRTEVNIQDRSHMTFPVLIGRNILVDNFLVDAGKNRDIFKDVATKKKTLSEYE
jgi:hypothetical protein